MEWTRGESVFNNYIICCESGFVCFKTDTSDSGLSHTPVHTVLYHERCFVQHCLIVALNNVGKVS